MNLIRFSQGLREIDPNSPSLRASVCCVHIKLLVKLHLKLVPSLLVMIVSMMGFIFCDRTLKEKCLCHKMMTFVCDVQAKFQVHCYSSVLFLVNKKRLGQQAQLRDLMWER